MPSVFSLYKSAQIQEITEAAIVMERNGFMIDTEFARWGQEKTKEDECATLAALALNTGRCGIPPLPGIDSVWSSSPQLVKLLHDEQVGLGLAPSPIKFKGRVNIELGERSTDKRALEYLLSHTEGADAKALLTGISDLRKIRSCAKYFNKLPGFVAPDGLVHPVTGPAGDDDDRVGAITGRFGMKNPEGQQIPSDKKKDRYRIRKMFIAPKGWKLISMDYSALEVVVLANICKYLFGDTQLLEMTAPGFDIHSYNARRVFGTFLGWEDDTGRKLADIHESLWKDDPRLEWFRQAIKEVWYGLMYGKSAQGFGISLKGKDGESIGTDLAKQIVKALMDSVPALGKWQGWCRVFVNKFRCMISQDGRKLDLNKLMAEGDWGVQAAFRAAYNYPMQAYGAYIIGAAMVKCINCPVLAELKCLLQLQIHDELMFRVPEEDAEMAQYVIKEHMETIVPGMSNLIVSGGIGDNWEQC